MRHKQEQTSIVDFIFTLSLFGVFAISTLLVVVIGANVYRSTVSTQEANAVKRTSLAYVTEKIRQNDESGSISIGEIEGVPALILKSAYGDQHYCTYIYVYQGNLRELFVKSTTAPTLIAGQIITEVTDFSIEQVSDTLYLVSSSDQNQEAMSMYIHTRSN